MPFQQQKMRVSRSTLANSARKNVAEPGVKKMYKMPQSVTVSVVIPTLNEAKNLPYVLTELPDIVSEVILVDGGSTDMTIQVAKELRPDIHILRQSGRGKGNALTEGFAATSGDIIVMMDADGSHDPQELPLFVDALVKGADFAKGSRFIHDGASEDFTWIRRFGNSCINLLANICFKVQFTDLCYGYNAFWSYCLPFLDIDCPGFEVETLMNIRACKANLKVKEVPSFEAVRFSGESKLKALHDGWRIVKTIVRERSSRKRTTMLPQKASGTSR
jgi:glycosyltransferase involved in cell wall biosynthesis